MRVRYDRQQHGGLAPDLMRRLADGDPVYSLGVRHARTADIARMASMASFDLVWVDLEHSSMSVDSAAQILASAHDLGLGAWVRVSEGDYGAIGRLLDCGASGIIMPKVETAAQAKQLAACCRFPPSGARSMIARLPQTGFAKQPAEQLVAAANARTVVQALIESPLGVANADAIAGIEGIDMLAIGANDLTAELGRPGDTTSAAFQEACRLIVQAARRHGKIAVIGGIADRGQFAGMLALGFAPLIFAGFDTDIIAEGLIARREDWRASLAHNSVRTASETLQE